MRRKILLILGIIVLFVIVFVAAVFLMLPTDAIRHFAEKNIEKQLKYEQGIEIETIDVSPLLNVTVKNFRMTPREISQTDEKFATEGGTFNGFYCAPYVENMPFTVDEIFINPEIASSIQGKPAGSFDLSLQNGKISGNLRSISDNFEIRANGKDISLNEFSLLSNITKMQIYGGLEFALRAVLRKADLAELALNMTASNTAMCPKRVKLDVPGVPFIELPFIVFGNITADVDISKGKLNINSLVSDGPDIKLNVRGSVTLKTKKNPIPRLNIEATITPSVEWVVDNDMKVIYQVCEKLDDGSIKLVLSGTTKRLKHDCGTPVPEPVEPQTTETKKIKSDDAAGEKKDTLENEEENDKIVDKKTKKIHRRPVHAEKKN